MSFKAVVPIVDEVVAGTRIYIMDTDGKEDRNHNTIDVLYHIKR
jgi:hypothetical protein